MSVYVVVARTADHGSYLVYDTRLLRIHLLVVAYRSLVCLDLQLCTGSDSNAARAACLVVPPGHQACIRKQKALSPELLYLLRGYLQSPRDVRECSAATPPQS